MGCPEWFMVVGFGSFLKDLTILVHFVAPVNFDSPIVPSKFKNLNLTD